MRRNPRGRSVFMSRKRSGVQDRTHDTLPAGRGGGGRVRRALWKERAVTVWMRLLNWCFLRTTTMPSLAAALRAGPFLSRPRPTDNAEFTVSGLSGMRKHIHEKSPRRGNVGGGFSFCLALNGNRLPTTPLWRLLALFERERRRFKGLRAQKESTGAAACGCHFSAAFRHLSVGLDVARDSLSDWYDHGQTSCTADIRRDDGSLCRHMTNACRGGPPHNSSQVSTTNGPEHGACEEIKTRRVARRRCRIDALRRHGLKIRINALLTERP